MKDDKTLKWSKLDRTILIISVFLVTITLIFSIYTVSCYPATQLGHSLGTDEYTDFNLYSFVDDPSTGLYGYRIIASGDQQYDYSNNGFTTLIAARDNFNSNYSYASSIVLGDAWTAIPPEPPDPPTDNTLGNIKIVGIDNNVKAKLVLDSKQFSYLIGLMLSAIWAAAWMAHL